MRKTRMKRELTRAELVEMCEEQRRRKEDAVRNLERVRQRLDEVLSSTGRDIAVLTHLQVAVGLPPRRTLAVRIEVSEAAVGMSPHPSFFEHLGREIAYRLRREWLGQAERRMYGVLPLSDPGKDLAGG